MWSLRRDKLMIPTAEQCLPGRAIKVPVPKEHYVKGHSLEGPYPEGLELAQFGLGCFWGAERIFWQAPGVWTTAVGYSGGHTPNPTYEEVCSGRTGHTEAVLVVYDPKVTSYEALLKLFWESHDPSQGMRQGNDVGTQYRSAIYTYTPEQRRAAEASRDRFQKELNAAGALANARTFGGENYDGYHAFMALLPAYQMSRELPAERQALPATLADYREAWGAGQHSRQGPDHRRRRWAGLIGQVWQLG